jgi:hypothetical protein
MMLGHIQPARKLVTIKIVFNKREKFPYFEAPSKILNIGIDIALIITGMITLIR